ncbi:MAG TPA: hypothetical protein VMH33_11460 [Solirubrobacterales bacterium]|nr:hypothetical protein [Solirubrobacterales bacterium]
MKVKDGGRRWRPGMLLGIVAMVMASALVLAACGGGSSSSSESTTTSSGSEGGGGPGGFQISDEQRSCLKEKGVELPEFKGGEGGMPPQGGEPPEGFEPPAGGAGGEQFKEQQGAFEECGVELGEFQGPGGKGGPPNTNSAAFKKQVKEYVACVRENGYELAEPNFSGEGPIFEKSESESAAFKEASEQCQGLLGGPRGGESG